MSFRKAWQVLLKSRAFYVALALDVVGMALVYFLPVPWHWAGLGPLAAGCFIICRIGD